MAGCVAADFGEQLGVYGTSRVLAKAGRRRGQVSWVMGC